MKSCWHLLTMHYVQALDLPALWNPHTNPARWVFLWSSLSYRRDISLEHGATSLNFIDGTTDHTRQVGLFPNSVFSVMPSYHFLQPMPIQLFKLKRKIIKRKQSHFQYCFIKRFFLSLKSPFSLQFSVKWVTINHKGKFQVQGSLFLGVFSLQPQDRGKYSRREHQGAGWTWEKGPAQASFHPLLHGFTEPSHTFDTVRVWAQHKWLENTAY